MKNSRSTEDYLKTILLLRTRNGNVRAIDVAGELGDTKPSVSAAMKKLRGMDMIYLDDNGYICLTKAGEYVAEKVNEKHLLITRLLTGIGVNEKTASEEACQIEHAIGEETYERLEELYGKRFS